MRSKRLASLSAQDKQKAKSERDYLRARLGKGEFMAIVKQMAATSTLAHEAGVIATVFGLEGIFRQEMRSDLCLQGWTWQDADSVARDLLASTYLALSAIRPTWEEGQPEWTREAGAKIERETCIRCRKPLPEGHYKYCNHLCRHAYGLHIRERKNATEDRAIWLATRSKYAA